jgi:uncharacterized protein YjbI with pentapeptide repeats
LKPDYRERYLERMPDRMRQSGLARQRIDLELVDLVRRGPNSWNGWRDENWETDVRAQRPSLFKADLDSLDLSGINLFNANLQYSILRGCKLCGANLQSADLTGANIRSATLTDAEMRHASFIDADLTGSDLSRSTLAFANFSDACLAGANISECLVYGVSAWNVKLDAAIQEDLLVTRFDEPALTTDSLQIAQLLHLLLTNANLRPAFDTITKKAVLILGRFTPERKAILDAIRDELRNRDYLPVLFDFEKPSSKTTIETVSTLAHMARFVVADLTDAKSVLQELQAVVPSNPSVPIQPIILNSQTEPGMFDFLRMFPWVLEPYLYEDQDGLLAAIMEKVIGPAEAKAKEQIGR